MEKAITTPAIDELVKTHFKKGAEVEVFSDDEGFRGSLFEATIVRPPTMRKRKATIEYKTLMVDENSSVPLREELDVVQLRPIPPRERNRVFKLNEEVDAYHNDGWWEGVITEVLEGGKMFAVFFRGTKEQMEFEGSQLRLHREWVRGDWVPPLEPEEEEEVPIGTGSNSHEELVEVNFGEGSVVEVSSDEDGFRGAWFDATVIKQLENGNYLIEYQKLRNDDDTEFMREEVDSMHIRPCPPDTEVVKQFKVLEEVDASHNDGWWVGKVSKVLSKQRYIVYFKTYNEEIEFKHCDLRLHQDWIDGKWVRASRALKS